VGGQVASEIATRQGGFVNLLTIENNTIPASGSVNVTAQKYRPITVNSAGAGQANLFGTIAGVHGVLNATFDSSGNMLTNTFTRTTAGSAVYVDPNSAFILDSNGSEFDIVVLWMGRNDVYAVDFSSRVMTALQACVQHMKYLNKRFIVISITNRTGSTEIKGTTAYNNIIAVNQSIQNMYPENYIDIRALMVRSYNPSIPQDVIDFNNDCPPSSLMFDDTHFNAAGYAIIAQAIKKFIQDKGWNS
ncbi:SGNH/GDSL hydrolase family protein, partial [Escherichia coli]|nr:SGNH/GDSL hydrolase family protein [Escherichia coli]HBK2804655.1 SGNH/GDSL hydrolase family protein [Escherichia coli]HCO7490704.1 SGNH/GDSL hydrolase family protein [Escherichia coli]HCO7500909.1 SGNH/GDSL hydrolase family protein [Escherichia coli]